MGVKGNERVIHPEVEMWEADGRQREVTRFRVMRKRVNEAKGEGRDVVEMAGQRDEVGPSWAVLAPLSVLNLSSEGPAGSGQLD